MDKCCTSQPPPRAQRRINGLQLPLHCQQIVGWIVFVATGALNFFVLIPIQFNELEIASEVIFGILYISHVTSHLSALLMDPSEKELRKLKVNNVPEFDRSIHAHVIENGRCHLCNIYTSSKKTKHCSICNKCVDQFDHHCKWLNNCIGGRNYKAFISSVVTALLISSFTTSLCLIDIVYFLVRPYMLSSSTQEYINCTLILETPETKYCRRSITFLTFLIIFCGSALAISCALMHLCCFHVYISVLGVSTYDYIVSGSTDDSTSCCKRKNFCQTNVFGKVSKISSSKKRITKKYSQNTEENGKKQTSEDNDEGQNVVKSDLTNLITTIIHNEVDKAKKIFSIDNRIHPTNDETASSTL